MGVKSIKNGNKDENVQEDNDYKRSFAQWLVIEARKMGLDFAELILEFRTRTHAAPLENR